MSKSSSGITKLVTLALFSLTFGLISISASLISTSPSQSATSLSPLGEWVQIPMPTDCDIFSSDFAGEADGWAVGFCESVIGDGILRWDGHNWTTYLELENTNFPSSVELLSSDDGWIVGSRGLILHWDGSKWESMAPEVDYHLYATSFLSPKLGWAVGGGVGYTPTDPENYSIILKWDGVRWKKIPNPGRFPLATIAMLSEDDGWAAGDLGVLLHWDGRTWKDFPAPDKDLVGGFTALSFVAPDNGWLVGGSVSEDWGVILHWDGKSWTEIQRTKYDLYSIAMVDSEFGWAVGGNNNNNFGGSVILHWDGKTWEEYPSPTEVPLNFVWANTHDDGWLFAGGVGFGATGEGNAAFRYVIKPEASSTPPKTASVVPTTTSISTTVSNSVIETSAPILPTGTPLSTSNRSTNSVNLQIIALIALFMVLITGGVVFIRRQRNK
jgi:photosystem II stability/assembly factor-like uncharacterized protein